MAGVSSSKVYGWRVEDGTQVWSLDQNYPINELAFSPDGSKLAAAISEWTASGLGSKFIPRIPVWNAIDGSLVDELKISSQLLMPGFSSLAFSTDGKTLIAAEGYGDIDVWQLADYTPKYSVSNSGLFGWNLVIAISPDGDHFASGGMDRQIRLWKIDGGAQDRMIDVKDDSVSALAYSPDGIMIASGVGNEIRVWRTTTGTLICSVKGSGDAVKKIFFTPDGRFLVSLADDGVVRIWGTP